MKKIICISLVTLLLATSLAACDHTNNITNQTDLPDPISNITDGSENHSENQLDQLTLDIKSESKDIYAEVIRLYEYPQPVRPESVDEQLWDGLKQVWSNWSSLDAGYCFKDINNDGKYEMILLDSDYNLHAIFTHVNGNVQFVKMFDPSGNGGVIDENGIIYDHGFGRFLSWYESAYVLLSNGELECLGYYGYRGDETGLSGAYFQKNTDGTYMDTTREKIEEFNKQYVLFQNFDTTTWVESMKDYLEYIPFDLSNRW